MNRSRASTVWSCGKRGWSGGSTAGVTEGARSGSRRPASSTPRDLVPTATPASAYLADAAEAARYGYVAVAAFATALAVAKAAGDGRADDRAYRLERAWQSAWIARALAL